MMDHAIALLQDANKAFPDKSNLVDQLGRLYILSAHPEKAEELYRSVIDKSPDLLEGRYRLASFYSGTNDFPKAVEAFKELLKHPSMGSGRDAIRNTDIVRGSTIAIASLNLEQIDRQGITAEQKAAYLKEAAEYTDKLRTSHASQGIIDLLDGRAQLANHDTLQAITTLREAEKNLNGDKNLVEWYRQAELLLAQANETLNQPGAALDYVNKALAIAPGDRMLIIEKARLYAAVRRYDEAELLLLSVLGEQRNGKSGPYANEPNLSASLVNRAKQVMVQVRTGQGNSQAALQSMTEAGAILQRSVLELSMGGDNLQDAITDAMLVIDDQTSREADVIVAYQVVISSYAKTNRMDRANELAAQAIAKYPKSDALKIVKAQLAPGPGYRSGGRGQSHHRCDYRQLFEAFDDGETL